MDAIDAGMPHFFIDKTIYLEPEASIDWMCGGDDEEPFETAGVVLVDSGQVWVGDPCHAGDVTRGDDTEDDFTQDGMGVRVSTGLGDGPYRVEVRKENGPFGRRVAEMRIVFMDDDGPIYAEPDEYKALVKGRAS